MLRLIFLPSVHSLREGNTVSMISRCCLLPVVTSVVRDAQTYEQVMLLTMLIVNCVPHIPTGEFIIGRVIKAMNNSWHPDCFCCDICQAVLADVGFVKNAGR